MFAIVLYKNIFNVTYLILFFPPTQLHILFLYPRCSVTPVEKQEEGLITVEQIQGQRFRFSIETPREKASQFT